MRGWKKSISYWTSIFSTSIEVGTKAPLQVSTSIKINTWCIINFVTYYTILKRVWLRTYDLKLYISILGYKCIEPTCTYTLKETWKGFVEFWNFHINCQNLIVFILHILVFENREHENFNWIDLLVTEILIFKLILIFRFLNVPCALGFEAKHSKLFCRSFRRCIIILSIHFTINKLFWS